MNLVTGRPGIKNNSRLKSIVTWAVPMTENAIIIIQRRMIVTLPLFERASGARCLAIKASILEAYSSSFLSSKSSMRYENFFYRLLRKFPLQTITESSLQQHNPKHSPCLACRRFRSSRNQGENIVKNEKYSITTQQPQKKQKLPRAGELDIEPIKNDKPSVTEVIVIEGPA